MERAEPCRESAPAVQESTLFLTVRELADLLADGAVTSVELTQAYLDRAEALDVPPFELPSEPRTDHDGKLATMVTIARDHALEAAERADRELAAGKSAQHLTRPTLRCQGSARHARHPHHLGVADLRGPGAGS